MVQENRSVPSVVIALVLGCSLASGVVACKKEQTGTTNAALVSEFSGESYEKDMETADEYRKHEDQGASISLRAQKAIQDTVEISYKEDFARCLEDEMERLENRNVSGTFSVEFKIDTQGKVKKATVIQADIKERKAAASTPEGQMRSADGFSPCVESLALQWEFDPPPEVIYTHTYTGEVGAAW